MKILNQPDSAKPSSYVGHTVLWKEKVYKVVGFESYSDPPVIILRKGCIKSPVLLADVEVLCD